MIQSYPHHLKTASGHSAVVSNPEKGKYLFEVIEANGDEYSFDWFDTTYTGEEAQSAKPGTLKGVEAEILDAFWHDQK